ncbi:DUF3040 domain-containing protein [Actinotalea sp.]|uniref:DUF3040 domain-containing protein n=1 Tax=Actinotalea sp. TaxID=1872145 RepID=UPI002C5486E3|nr:DUF3040 domain-containing protein [Actinotalea sp.]HQY33421.1 DUF3040 domain-containing protein [Actinotalea sp.]HRA49777.1 DUF3040 domain-containing protein [Actinotalea sp.]
MPLSEYEQRVLEQMERQLTSDDPKLVHALQGRAGSPVRRWVISGVGAVVGLGLLVTGAATSLPWIGVLGFVAMFLSVLYALTPRRTQGPTGVVNAQGGVKPRPAAAKTSFLTRLEARWERRRDGR